MEGRGRPKRTMRVETPNVRLMPGKGPHENSINPTQGGTALNPGYQLGVNTTITATTFEAMTSLSCTFRI